MKLQPGRLELLLSVSFALLMMSGCASNTTKTAAINQIFGAGSSPQKTLATAMWNTCQAHFNSANEPFFLPWHRMYVCFFEEQPSAISDWVEPSEIRGVGQLVEHNNSFPAANKHARQRRADETCATGDQVHQIAHQSVNGKSRRKRIACGRASRRSPCDGN